MSIKQLFCRIFWPKLSAAAAEQDRITEVIIPVPVEPEMVPEIPYAQIAELVAYVKHHEEVGTPIYDTAVEVEEFLNNVPF